MSTEPFPQLHMQTGEYHRPYRLQEPFPRFCVLRPNEERVPLIALDELPRWVQLVRPWEKNEYESFYPSMIPVTWIKLPRTGEYDVICSYCSASIDSVIQRTISQHSDKPASPLPAYAETQTFPGGFPTAVLRRSVPTSHNLSYSTSLTQPPFHAQLHSPFIGMCLVDLHLPDISFDFDTVIGQPQVPQITSPEGKEETNVKPVLTLNPEANAFSPSSPSERFGPHSFPLTPTSEAGQELLIEDTIEAVTVEALFPLLTESSTASDPGQPLPDSTDTSVEVLAADVENSQLEPKSIPKDTEMQIADVTTAKPRRSRRRRRVRKPGHVRKAIRANRLREGAERQPVDSYYSRRQWRVKMNRVNTDSANRRVLVRR
ncbi:hypothetical protein ASPZODRAFT_130727 [Penicilliopsis zonata CBS 506.65]|uniref:Uncharacterized protein n=1 Tax=Penicilliopsis zonata CBS 506.65 TaxID=1073090 RepID=A0A1L9SN59_9EURO|nr:hypothetical protein ASPZODRAFT_130727 [Penicilliopsis zonata CBS 506.65]OJJ48628.1 hypothetical protein ASPZODRAFT_130727 [Penicilliopsis zonata CBS 506.65]